MLRLVARSGDRVRLFSFPIRSAVIGAAAGNDLVLPFPGVSRRHARLQPLGRDLLLVDLGSKNGLVCGGQRVPQALLSCGGEVCLGTAALTLEESATSETELGLTLACEPERVEPPPTTPSFAPEPPVRSMRAALRLIRRVERSAWAAGAGAPGLAAARPILGAASVFAFRATGDDIAITDCHGEVPVAAVGRALAKAGPQGGLLRIAGESAPATVLLGAAGTGGTLRIAAIFAGTGPGAEAWERDLFDYLAGRLGAAGEPSPPGATQPPTALLRLAEGLVPGTSEAAVALLDKVKAAAGSRREILVLGETGTGKELVARTLHASSARSAGPFVAINCAAIPADLAEAELFGVHGRVATGVDPRPGLLARAHGGTLFLDEIGELALDLQAKLLRVLAEREVLALGASAPRAIEVRVISASNRDLAALVAAGGFRADLYYRLRGFEIFVPPLRERRADIPQLAAAFANRAAAAYGKRVLGISRRALACLTEYSWPGNVRELAAEVERAVLLCPDGGVLATEHLALGEGGGHAVPAAAAAAPSPAPALTLEERIAALERETLTAALAASGGNKAAAARALGLTRNGLNLKLKRLGIEARRR